MYTKYLKWVQLYIKIIKSRTKLCKLHKYIDECLWMMVIDYERIWSYYNINLKVREQKGGIKVIYTVTFNPSLDYIVSVEDFKLGMTNRTSSEQILAGGKGINVSIVLKNLGLENTAYGFIAGFTGEQISTRLDKAGVNADFIKVDKGMSRINLKLTSIDGTEINGLGPDISKKNIESLLGRLEGLKAGDVLVLAGSIPACIPDDIYMNIMKLLKGKGVMVVVDATSSLLMNVLKYKPFLIKPNQHELGDIFGVTLSTRDEVVPYALRLKEMGAVNVLISMGGKGAVLVADDNKIYMAEAPKGTLKNSVGAGDSMVAGFITGWLTEHNYEAAFKLGIAAGSASAFSDKLATRAEVEALMDNINILNTEVTE